MSKVRPDKGFFFLWKNSWRMLRRDWSGGELNILAIGLVIAVTSTTTVGFFTDRIERGLKLQSAELIGADLVITSANPTVNNYIDDVRANDLQVATTQQFRSVAIGNNQPQLVEVKAVSEAYPLRGVLRVSDTPFGADEATIDTPSPGDVWVEPRFLQLLKLEVGDTITLGASTFTLRKVLRFEPDRGGDLFSIAPRVLMNFADVEATGLIGVGALVRYRLLMSGLPGDVENYRQTISNNLRVGEQILTLEEGRPELNTALDRARQFLGLAALISVLLAGVAVATVAYRFASRHLDTSAMLRCLGTSQKIIIRLFGMEMLWLALLSSTVGCLLGVITQLVITELLDQLLIAKLPSPSFKAVFLGYATGIVMLIGFALPPLLSLRGVPPLRVLRKDIGVPAVSSWFVYLAVAVCMSLLLYWQIGDLKLVCIVLGGILVTLMLLALAAYLLILLLNRLRGRVGVAWRFGLANISRRPASSTVQIVAFGLGIMVLLLLSAVRSDLLDNWQRSLPPDAPNHFVINVQPDQVEGVSAFFKQRGVANTQLYPMVRARLAKVNGNLVRTADYDNARAKRMITREFNLSWVENMQADNKLASGRWWSRQEFGKPLLSLESQLSATLGLKLNDVVSFDVNGTVIDFTLINLRNIEWDTFNINFFTVVAPGVLEQYPANWVTSVYLNPEQRQELGQLVAEFPNVTLIDVEVIMQRVRDIMDRVSLAVEFIFLFTLMAGLAVLYAAIQSNQDERRFENAVLRTLGASRKTLMMGLFAEFTLLGALSGLLAGLSATSLAWLLAKTVFKFEYSFDIGVVFIGVVSGTVIVVIAGLLGTRGVLALPPIQTLRNSQS